MVQNMKLIESLKFVGKYNKKTTRNDKSYLVPVTGYDYTPSIIKSGKRYGTVVSVVNKFGMNRNKQYGWFVDLIPQISVPNVKAYLFVASKPMSKKEQQKIFNKKVSGTIKTLDSHNDPKGASSGEIELRVLHANDLEMYTKKDTKEELGIDFQILMLLVSDNPDDVAEQLRVLKRNYADDMAGIDLMSVAGDQKALFKRLLKAPRKSVYDYCTMSSDFAGFDHSVRKGLDDENGVSVGELTVSLSNGNALMDLDGSFSKRILVSASSDSFIYQYDRKLSASSMWGQKIANHTMMNGHRVFHMVMNSFRYYSKEGKNNEDFTFSCPPEMESVMKRVDLSRGGLNPIEMFGDKKNAIEIYNTHKRKIAQIFYYITQRQLSRNSLLMLEDLLNQFYYSNKLWDDKVNDNPLRARIIGVEKPETVPTSGDFLTWLKENLEKIRLSGTETEINNAKDLYLTLKNALDSYPHLFNTTTNLPLRIDKDVLQYYYDLSGLRGNPELMEAQFLNTFDYITQLAQEGDVIMLHGINKLTTETLDIVKNRIEVLMDAGIRMAYLFDEMSTGNPIKGKEDELIYYSDMFNTKDILFKNFESQFDYTILGTMTRDEFEKYQRLIRQKLPKDLADIITAADQPLQYQIRRPSDLTSNYILADFIV